MLGSITPLNTMTTSFTVGYHQTSGIESLTHFERTEALHQLTAVGLPGSPGLGIEATFTLKTSKAIELKA